MASAIIKANQSIFDVAVQYYGSPDYALKICTDNGLSLDSDLVAGNLIAIDLQNTSVPAYFRQNNITVSNWEGLFIVTPPTEELREDLSSELREDFGIEFRQ